jgi:hypothetical protein
MKKKCCFIIAFAVIGMVSLNSKSHIQYEHTDEEDIPAAEVVSEEWESLFDGETLDGWEIVRYFGAGIPYVKDGSLILPAAVDGLMTGVRWIGGALPVNNYIIFYEARRVEGNDIFAGLTFPYKDTFASLIFGGWGGIVNGLSSIDGYDASENETTQHFSQRNNEWYQVQLHVTSDSIRAFVGAEKVVDLATAKKDIHLRDDILNTGLTLWTYVSTGEIRDLRIKKLP